MSRFIIAIVVALTATTATTNAANSNFEQSQAPAVAGKDSVKPFLFDARLPGDEVREKAARDRQPNGGTIIVPSKANQPERDR